MWKLENILAKALSLRRALEGGNLRIYDYNVPGQPYGCLPQQYVDWVVEGKESSKFAELIIRKSVAFWR